MKVTVLVKCLCLPQFCHVQRGVRRQPTRLDDASWGTRWQNEGWGFGSRISPCERFQHTQTLWPIYSDGWCVNLVPLQHSVQHKTFFFQQSIVSSLIRAIYSCCRCFHLFKKLLKASPSHDACHYSRHALLITSSWNDRGVETGCGAAWVPHPLTEK